MDAELVDRVMECLRGCDIGESISADEIADEIGGKLSDVYDALEDLENAKLAQMHAAATKGRDPTYTLTPKGKRAMQPDGPNEPEPVVETPADDCACQYCGTVMASPARKRNHEPVCGKNPYRNNSGGKRTGAAERMIERKEAIAQKYAGEPRPKDTPEMDNPEQCRWCMKVLCDKKYRVKHEDKCQRNPKNKHIAKNPAEAESCPEPVPDPAEYAEAESTATVTIEHEMDFEEQPFAPAPALCGGCENYNRADGTCLVNCVTVGSCFHAYRPAEPQLQDVPTIDEILGQQQAAEDPDIPDKVPQNEVVLKGSPGMDAALRLISFCQQMAGSGAQVSVDATVQVSEGFHIHVDLCVPSPKEESDE